MALDLKKQKGGKRSGKCVMDPTLDAAYQVRVIVVRKEDGATISSRAAGVSEKHVEAAYAALEKAMPGA